MVTSLKIGKLVLRQLQYALIPALPEEDYAALKADVAAVGKILQPIVIDEEGTIVDGHHRARAAVELGLDPGLVPTIVMPGLSEDEKIGRAIALNLKRRHLTEENRREIAAHLRARSWSFRTIASAMGTDPATVYRWLDGCSTVAYATVEQPSIVLGADGKQRPAEMPELDDLAERRTEVRRRRAEGATVRQIADDLHKSVGTISSDLKAGSVVVTSTARQAAAVLDALPFCDELPSEVSEPRAVFKQERRDNIARAQEEILTARLLAPEDDPDARVLAADFREWLASLPAESVELILTDPPSDRESLPLYAALAREAMRLLAPGGSLIAYAGNYALPEIFDACRAAGLRYWWMLGVRHASNFKMLPGKYVSIGWKPLVWFVKESRGTSEMVFDLLDSPKPAKVMHEWEQGEAEAAYLIERLTGVGQTVLDPMCGSGTTLVAAKLLGREYLGCDRNPDHVRTARRRLAAC